MRRQDLQILCCPRCRGDLLLDEGSAQGVDIRGGTLQCGFCAAQYPVENSIPSFLGEYLSQSAGFGNKQSQIKYFDKFVEFDTTPISRNEILSFNDYMLYYKLAKTIHGTLDFRKAKVFISCSGSGREAEYFSEIGADVYMCDISAGILKTALKRGEYFGYSVQAYVGDSERLPFKNDSFDIGFIHDGLHHLSNPFTGIYELWRVCRRGVIIIEPRDALLTRLYLRMLGKSNYEEGPGNYVYRFSRREYVKIFQLLKCSRIFSKSYMLFAPDFGVFHKLYRTKIGSVSYNALLGLFNLMFGFMGNKITVMALK